MTKPQTQALELELESNRAGFGRGLLAAAKLNPLILALAADISGSAKMDLFAAEFPERFVQIGVAEQNLVTVASGLAAIGFIPFATSYAAFMPGRCWEQIRTTICINNQNVKLIGSHAGLSVGPDGATHQMLEDIALMRSLPNMQVFVPADSAEAEQITKAIAKTTSPSYMRLARSDTPVFLDSKLSPNFKFKIGQALQLHKGADLTILSTGTLTYTALQAALKLKLEGVNAEVLHFATIKPLDEVELTRIAAKGKPIITVEEHQISGGFGSAICEFMAEFGLSSKIIRIGVNDQFGQSGTPEELLRLYGLTDTNIIQTALNLVGGGNSKTGRSKAGRRRS